MSIFDEYRKKNRKEEEEGSVENSLASFRGQNDRTKSLFQDKGYAEVTSNARLQINTSDSIRKFRENNIAQRDYEIAEREYMASLPNDAYRDAYTRSKENEGVYVSPYFTKGIEGKEKLKYNNDEWNNLSEKQKRKYLEWAQEDLDNGKTDSSNRYLQYAKRIISGTEGDISLTNSITNMVRSFGETSLGKLIKFDKLPKDLNTGNGTGTFDEEQEVQIMLNMMPEEVRQYLTTGMVNLVREGQTLNSAEAIEDYLAKYYPPDILEKLTKYARKVENIQKQQERNEDTERKMENPLYATFVAPAKQIGTDLLVKPVAGTIDAYNSLVERNKGMYGEFDPLATDVQKMAQDARYINESINSGLGPVGRFAYGTSVSAAESAVRAYLAGGLASTMPFLNTETTSKVLLSGMMSTAVFNDDLNENLQKGMNLNDAVGSAVAHSIFETLFEEISLDKLGYFQDAPVLRSKKEFIKALGKAALVEGSEEAFTDIANELYDHYVGNYDFSEYKAFKDKYLASNPDASDAEVWWNFTKQFSWQVAQSFAGGALSSFALSSTKNMSALHRGEIYVQNGRNVSDADYNRMNAFVEEMAAVNPNIANQLAEATEGGEDARRGFVKMVTDEYSEKFNKEIEKAKTKDKLNVVMNNVNAVLHGAISEDTFNTYNAKLVELGETPADYNTFVQNRQRGGETTFSDLAYGRGDNAIQRNIVEASKSIAETRENAKLSESERETAIKGYAEKVEQNVKKAEDMVARYAQMGKALDSPEVRQFESVLGLENMAQIYSAGKIASENKMLPSVTGRGGKLYAVDKNSEGAMAIFGENIDHIQDVPFNELQKTTAYSLGKVLAKMTGVDVAFYKSDRQKVQNGAFHRNSNTIYIDVNAGVSGADAAVGEVFSHELTHWIRSKNEEGYQRLLDFVKADLGDSYDSMLKDHMDRLGLDEDVAGEEIVAEACQRMLKDSDTFKRYASADMEGAKTLLQRLVDFVRKLRDAFKGSLNNEATRMIQNLEGLQQTWETALQEAIGEQTAMEGGIDVETLDDTAVRDSIRTVLDEKQQERVSKMLQEKLGVDKKTADEYIENEQSIASLIFDNIGFLDYKPDDRYEAIKKNSDYPQGTVDMTNLCRKRAIFTQIFDSLQEHFPNRLFNAMDIADIREVLKTNGYQVACALCFVEDRRQRVGEIAENFIERLKESNGKTLTVVNSKGETKELFMTKDLANTDVARRAGFKYKDAIKVTDKYIPNQYDLVTYEGFKALSENHPQVAVAFTRANNYLGMSSARLVEGRAEYKRDILKYTPTQVKRINNKGGLRIFSFSDFEAVHLLDICQVIMDASAVGLKIQAYTKVPAFAKLVANTGIKLNRSLIASGKGFKVNPDGSRTLTYDTHEGIDINDRDFFDSSDNPNIGNILVGISDEHIRLAMEDDFVDYIIPFHSNQGKNVLAVKGISHWTNYKEYQRERYADGRKGARDVNIYTQVIDKYHPTNKVEFVEAFLKECKAQGKIPRFDQFLNKVNGEYVYTPGYEKLLLDFKLFDKQGNILPQNTVNPNIDMEVATRILDDEVKGAEKREQVSGKIIKELEKKYEVRNSSRDSERDSEYMAAVNSGDMETAQKMVDEVARENGYTEEYYHGTHTKFNSFDLDKSKFGNSGYGIYLGSRLTAAEFGGDDTLRLYVNHNRIATSEGHKITPRQFQRAFSRLGISAEKTYKRYVDTVKEYVSKRNDWNIVYDLQLWADMYGKTKKKMTPSEILSVLREELGYDGMENRRELVLWDNKLLKSADAITYDDNGNVIPLSERFNKGNDDIRYSERDSVYKDDSGKKLPKNYQEFLKGTTQVYSEGVMKEFLETAPNTYKVYYNTEETHKPVYYLRTINPWRASDHIDELDHMPYEERKGLVEKIKASGYDSVDINVSQILYTQDGKKLTYGDVYLFDDLNRIETPETAERMARENAVKEYVSNPTDSEGRELSEAQKEFFAYSKVRDENGNLKPMFHGTNKGGFTIFDSRYSDDKLSLFFTDSPSVADSYIYDRMPSEKYEVYLNIKNPLVIDAKDEMWSKIVTSEGVKKDVNRIEFEGAADNRLPFVFLSQEQADRFNKEYHISEWRGLLEEARENGTVEWNGNEYDEYEIEDEISELEEEAYKEYSRDIRGNLVAINGKDFIEHPENYTWFDFYAMIDELSNGNADMFEDAIGGYKESGMTLHDAVKEWAAEWKEQELEMGQTETEFEEYLDNFHFMGLPSETFNEGKEVKTTRQIARRAYNDGYDGVIIKNVYDVGANGIKDSSSGLSTVVIAFYSNQIKSVDNLNPTENDDIRFSYRDLANSESEILVNALKNDATLVDQFGARKSVEAYAKAYGELKEMENQAIEYAKQLKKGTSPSEREAILRKQVRLDRAILNKTTELTEMRNQRVIRDLLIDEWEKRDTMVAAGRAEERLQTRKALEEKYGKELSELKAKNKAQQKAIRDRQKSKHLKENIIKKTRDIMKRIATPTEKKHVPTVLVKPISELIEAIDYWTPKEGRPVTKTSEQLWTRFQNFKNAVEELQTETDKAAEAIKDRFDPDFLDYVNQISKYITEQGIDNVNDMNVENLEALDSILTELNHIIKTANDMFSRSRFKTADELRQVTKEDLNKRKGLKEGKSDARGNFVRRTNAGMADAYAWAEYAGEGAKEIVNMLSKAYNRKINLIRQATEYTEDVLKPVKKDLKKWEKDEKTFKLESGKELKLNVRTMLDIYLLSKREQGYQHLISDSVSERLEKEAARANGEDVTFYNGGGIRVKDRKGKFRTLMKFTQSDLNQVIDYLKTVPNAIEVAEKLQKFISTEATAWGNKASNDLYGIVKYTEENYWPISTSDITNADNGTGQSVSTNVDMNKIKNYGFTKALQQNAKNGVDVDDFLNVFSKHIDEMSSYGELLPALTDAMRWWNSRTDSEDNRDERIKDLMASKIGTDMANVFNSIIIGLNGGTKTQDSLASWIRSLRGKVKAAAIAFNPRVVVQQPFSYTRAAAVIEKKYLTKALTMVPAVKEAQEHSAIAWLKHQGFHSSGIGPSMKKLVTGDGTAMENLVEKTMAPAGWADDITWGTLWNAAKLKVEDTQKNLEKGSQEYFDAIEDVFNEIINRTQVVETPLTQSPWMKSNMGTLYMSFMNEPVKTYSMVMTAIDKVVRDPHNAEARRQLYNAAGTFMVSGFALALAQSLVDAARDDDKELSYWEKYVEKYKDNALDNVNPLTYLPLIKDAWSVAQGYSSKDLTSQGTNEVINATKELIKVAKGESKHTLWGQAEIMARAYSYMSGVPVSNAMRIFKSVGGNMLGNDFFRSTDYTKSELGRNVVLELRDGNTEQAEKYFNQLQKKVGEDEDPYAYISDYLAKRDDDADIGARNFLEDANSLEEYAEKIVNKYNSEYVTLDVATDSIRKAARGELKEDAKANGIKYKNTISSGNTAGTLWNGSDINRALENGDIVEAQKLIDKINAGYKKQESNTTAKTSVSNYWKPKYLASSGAERDKIARMLYSLKNNGKQMFSAKDLQKWVADANKSSK